MSFLTLMVALLLAAAPPALSWSKEGHIMTCRIAQSLLHEAAAEAVQNLLPDYTKGDLSSLCVWPDQVRHWYKYRWTSPLHFIDTPDKACTFDYSRDCKDPKGTEDMCVAGAVSNFSTQLLHYQHGTADRRYNLTEALLFLSHFMGDIHQPMHVGFSSDEGGNTIQVWDREIILTALTDYYEKDMDLFLEDIQNNFTQGVWSDDISSWGDCEDLSSCPSKYATESINLACKWGYNGVTQGETLADEYFDSRLPIVTKRIAQGGVRLAVVLNRVLGDQKLHHIPSPT
ncbi:endonuclease 1 [Phalaenopsis equestris]|uniref:endonuclease 1 n=1 Tax=Phalaenopsis equestris TaxID=78828 RepID=UPI0009E3DE2B|nr:endonuclease 1 [Phalaenopsis equestris]